MKNENILGGIILALWIATALIWAWHFLLMAGRLPLLHTVGDTASYVATLIGGLALYVFCALVTLFVTVGAFAEYSTMGDTWVGACFGGMCGIGFLYAAIVTAFPDWLNAVLLYRVF